MRAKHPCPGWIGLVSLVLLSSCTAPSSLAFTNPDPPDPPIGVTPIDTSAPTLTVTITIDEDQDATDHLTDITFRFSTTVIEEKNYVKFNKGQYVTCNNKILTLGTTAQTYTLPVPRHGDYKDRYACFYIGYKNGSGLLPAVPMIDVIARSELSPQQPQVRGEGYTISYTRDSSNLACTLTANALDASSHIDGPPSSSDSGTYVGPATTTLKGEGQIVLKRTCSWTLDYNPAAQQFFHKIFLTYQSTASVEVTWTH